MGAGQGTLGLEADPVSPEEPLPGPEPAPDLAPVSARPSTSGSPEDADVEALVRRALDGRPGRSPLARTCPFLRAGDGEAATAPGPRPDRSHRCLALAEPMAPGLLQQEIVCLTAAHVDCPRYARGLVAARAEVVIGGDGARLPPAVRVAAGLVAVVAALVLAAFLLSGGLKLPGAGSRASATPSPTPAASPSPTPSPSPAPSPSPTPTPTASPSPTPTPTASPSPTPAPTSTARPTGSDPRYAGLQRCPAPQTCYIYIARSYSTVSSIASYFQTTIAVIEQLNPQIDPRTHTIYTGESIKVPPPQ